MIDVLQSLRIVLAKLESEGHLTLAQDDTRWLAGAIAEIERLRAPSDTATRAAEAMREAAAKVADWYEARWRPKPGDIASAFANGSAETARKIAAVIRELPAQPDRIQEGE